MFCPAQPVAEESAPVHATRDLLGIPANRSEYLYEFEEGTHLTLDVYHPRMPKPPNGYPTIIWFHGGAWLMGSKRDDLHVDALLSHGFAIVSVQYRLSTAAEFPAQIKDAREAASWVLRKAESLHLDRNKLLLAGQSAGGHLALLTAYTEGQAMRGWGEPLPTGTTKGVIAFYPPSDLLELVPPSARDNPAHPVALLLGDKVERRAPLAKAASPINYVEAGLPPTLLFHGTQDMIVPANQSKNLARKLVHHHVPVKLVLSPAGHGFAMNQRRLQVTEQFLRGIPEFQDAWRKRPWWQQSVNPPAEPEINGRPRLPR